MKAIILAAGVGRRLQQDIERPKCLLEFDDTTLLSRHLAFLSQGGVSEIHLCVGYEHEQIRHYLTSKKWDHVELTVNPDFREGSMISLWAMRDVLCAEDDVILMDADVLYDAKILQRLLGQKSKNQILIDRNFEAGDEPVKVCVAGSQVVEFRKQIDSSLVYDTIGESVGFFRFSATAAKQLSNITEQYVANGEREAPCEEAIRDLLLSDDMLIEIEDITGLPWIEIDFPEDIDRATKNVLPHINAN